VPRWTISAGGEYDHPIRLGAREVSGYIGLDYSYRSSENSVATDSIYSLLPDLSFLNLRVGVRSEDNKWDFYVWSKNVLNAKYFTFISPGVGNTGALDAQLGDPRTIGVTLRFHY
jgi:iron complex outermembrane receptor protein